MLGLLEAGGAFGGGAAAAGAAISPAQWLMAGSSVLSAAMAPSPSPAYSSASQYVDQTFDFGNWTVATGQAKAEGGDEGLTLSPLVILAGLALVVIAWKRKRN